MRSASVMGASRPAIPTMGTSPRSIAAIRSFTSIACAAADGAAPTSPARRGSSVRSANRGLYPNAAKRSSTTVDLELGPTDRLGASGPAFTPVRPVSQPGLRGTRRLFQEPAVGIQTGPIDLTLFDGSHDRAPRLGEVATVIEATAPVQLREVRKCAGDLGRGN